MKNLLLLLSACALITTAACKKSKSVQPTVPEAFSANPSMTGTVDEKDWTATYALYGSVIGSIKPVEFNLAGMAGPNTDIIYIRLFDYKGEPALSI